MAQLGEGLDAAFFPVFSQCPHHGQLHFPVLVLEQFVQGLGQVLFAASDGELQSLQPFGCILGAQAGLGVLDGAKGKSPGQGSTQDPSERGLVAGQKFFHGGSLANRLLR